MCVLCVLCVLRLQLCVGVAAGCETTRPYHTTSVFADCIITNTCLHSISFAIYMLPSFLGILHPQKHCCIFFCKCQVPTFSYALTRTSTLALCKVVVAVVAFVLVNMPEPSIPKVLSEEEDDNLNGLDSPRDLKEADAPIWGSSDPNRDNEGAEDDDNSGSESEEENDFGELHVWANDENRAIHQNVTKLQQKRETLAKKLDSNEKRVAVLEQHLKQVQQEAKNTERLNNAKEDELKSENHLRSLAERQIGRLEQEIKTYKNKSESLEDDLNTVQSDIFAAHEQIGKLQLDHQFNAEGFERWQNAVNQKAEDAEALEKYTRADEALIKELLRKQEQLTIEMNEAKRLVDNEVTETQAKQIELEKLGEQFRKVHAERGQLVRQWQESLDTMARRDEEIQRAGIEYGNVMQENAEKDQQRIQHADRLEMQRKDNKEKAAKILIKERQLAQIRATNADMKKKKADLEADMRILKSELQKAAESLEQRRVGNTNSANLVKEKMERLDSARERLQKVKMKLEKFKDASDNVEAVAKVHEDIVRQEEANLEKQHKNLDVLKERMFKVSQELFKLRKVESNLTAEISGAQAASRNLNDRIQRLDAKALRQQEHVYMAEFEIQQLERKVARASGVRSDEEKKAMNAQIETLKANLEQVQAENKMLAAQRKKLENELKKSDRLIVTLSADHEKINADITELTLRNSQAEKEMAAMLTDLEDRMITFDTAKLEIKKLKERLSSKADEVYGLENREFQLRMSMDERRREIQVHMDVQKAEIKAAEDERHQMAVRQNEQRQRLAAIRAKFDAIAAAPAVDENGQPITQAYYVIKAVQRKEELQRKGDILDAKIRTAEKETRALEKTLRHLTAKNEQFRQGFHAVDANSDMMFQYKSLEEQAKSATENLFSKRKQLHRLQHDIEDLQERLSAIQGQHQQALNRREQLANALEMVKREYEDEAAKAKATRDRVMRHSDDHRASRNADPTEPTLDEKRLRAIAVRENTQNVLFTLKELINECPEVETLLLTELKKANLSLQDRPPSAVSVASSIDSPRD